MSGRQSSAICRLPNKVYFTKNLFTMKNPIIRNGVYSGLLMLVLFAVAYFIGGDFEKQEIIGYLSILISLVFVFLGIKQYRDEIGKGSISFGKAMQVGLLIVLVPSIVFGLYNLFYIEYLDPNFIDNYYAEALSQMKASLSPDEFKIKAAALESEKEAFGSPMVQFGAMAATVFLMGVVVSVISSFVLKND